MGRVINSSAGSAGASSLSSLISNFQTAEDVQQGDLISVGSDGLAYWSGDPTKSTPTSILRPFTSTKSFGGLIGTTSQITTTTPMTNSVPSHSRTVQLSNGNFVNAWSCTATPYNSAFTITDPLGAVVVPTTSGPANNQNESVGLCALTGGGFVLATVNQAASSNVYFTIYDNNGIVTTASTRFGTTAGVFSKYTFALVGLSNGGFAMAADLMSGANQVPFIGVFTSTGATVKAPASPVASTSGGPYAYTSVLVKLTGGGFGFSFASGNSKYAGTYDSSGNLQGSLTSFPVGTDVSSSDLGQGGAVALPNGGWLALYTATYSLSFAIFNSSGVATTPATVLDTGGANTIRITQPVVLSSGNILIAYTGGWTSTNLVGWVITPAGVSLTGTMGTSPNLTLLTAITFGAGSMLAYGTDSAAILTASGNTVNYIKILPNPPYFSIDSPATSIVTGDAKSTFITPVAISSLSYAPSTSNPIFYVSAFSSTITQALKAETRYTVRQAMTPMGVALSSVSAGNSVPVQVIGTASTRLNIVPSYAVDATAGSIPGQRMFIIGNSACMYGVQLSTRRQIN